MRLRSALKIEMHRALLARVNGWANASDSFQETFEEAKYYLGERYEQRQAHLYRHIQALPHVQYAGKPVCKNFSTFIDKNCGEPFKFLSLTKRDGAPNSLSNSVLSEKIISQTEVGAIFFEPSPTM